jgi:hypothetical protein
MACSTFGSRRLLRFYDSALTTSHDLPISVHVTSDEPISSINELRQFSSDANVLLTDLAEAPPLV